MGILRTNKISGLETPTPVTGSVSFDGTGDYLTLASSGDINLNTGDFTLEAWVYHTGGVDNTIISDINGFTFTYGTSGKLRFYMATGSNVVDSVDTFISNSWVHIAVVRKSGIITFYQNGIGSGSQSYNYNIAANSGTTYIGKYHSGTVQDWKGFISNLRLIRGTALYTSNFTPPVNELQPIGDTVLLCCNSSTSATAEATGKIITVNGNAAASTVSPGLTRDYIYGTQFEGVARFDTQGYFVPPSGNTQNRYTLGLNEIVTSGLVLHLDAGNPLSYPVTGVGTYWNDLSGNNNRGILYNGVSYTDNNRGALVFDGTDDYADFFAPNLGTTTTVEMWTKMTNSAGMLFGWLFYDVYVWDFRLGFNTASSDLYGISATRCSELNIFNDNKWNHFVFEMRSDVSYTNNKIYVNGVSESLSQLSGTESGKSFNSGNGRISGWRVDASYRKLMNCSVFKVYNRALTAAEVLQNYNALKGRYGYT